MSANGPIWRRSKNRTPSRQSHFPASESCSLDGLRSDERKYFIASIEHPDRGTRTDGDSYCGGVRPRGSGTLGSWPVESLGGRSGQSHHLLPEPSITSACWWSLSNMNMIESPGWPASLSQGSRRRALPFLLGRCSSTVRKSPSAPKCPQRSRALWRKLYKESKTAAWSQRTRTRFSSPHVTNRAVAVGKIYVAGRNSGQQAGLRLILRHLEPYQISTPPACLAGIPAGFVGLPDVTRYNSVLHILRASKRNFKCPKKESSQSHDQIKTCHT
jgi:hypothetical protein